MMCVCNRPIYLYQFRWFSFWKTKNWIYRHLTVPLIFFFELNSDWADSGFTELTSNLFLNQETLELDWSYLRFKVESVQAAARKQGQSDLCEQYPSLSCSHHWRCWLEETRLCPRICSEAALCWRRWIWTGYYILGPHRGIFQSWERDILIISCEINFRK